MTATKIGEAAAASSDEMVIRDLDITTDFHGLEILVKKVWNLNFKENYWKWKFKTAPFPTRGFVVENGQVAAFQGLWQREMIVNQKTIPAVLMADMMTDPEFAGMAFKKIITKLTQIIPQGNILYGFTNPTSHKLSVAVFSRKKQVRGDTYIPVYKSVLNGGAFIPVPGLKNILGIVHKSLMKLAFTLLPSKGVNIKQSQAFDTRYSAFFEKAQTTYRSILKKDLDYLNWRYLNCIHNNYFILEAEKDGDYKGFMVLSFKNGPRGKKGLIFDWMVEKNDLDTFQALIKAAMNLFLQKGYIMAELPIMQHEHKWISIIKKFGFFKAQQGSGFLIGYEDRIFEETMPLKLEDLFMTTGDTDYIGHF